MWLNPRCCQVDALDPDEYELLAKGAVKKADAEEVGPPRRPERALPPPGTWGRGRSQTLTQWLRCPPHPPGEGQEEAESGGESPVCLLGMCVDMPAAQSGSAFLISGGGGAQASGGGGEEEASPEEEVSLGLGRCEAAEPLRVRPLRHGCEILSRRGRGGLALL